MTMRIVVITPPGHLGDWAGALSRALPEAQVIDHNAQPGYDPAGVTYAVVWRPPPGALAALPDLKAVCNLGAGVDAVIEDAAFPKHIPVIRLIDPAMSRDMSQYVMYWTLHFFRRFEGYRAAQAERAWRLFDYGDPGGCTVGFLGLGEMGGRCAWDLRSFGFTNLAAWTRTPKQIEGVRTFTGDAELEAFLGAVNIAVCLLPLTPETEGIINARTLAMLPKGAVFINCGRGRHVVLEDLTAAVDAGHIAAAVLDVTEPEPLPPEHPAWGYDNIFITPHVSALTYTENAAPVVAESIRQWDAGEKPAGLVDRGRAY